MNICLEWPFVRLLGGAVYFQWRRNSREEVVQEVGREKLSWTSSMAGSIMGGTGQEPVRTLASRAKFQGIKRHGCPVSVSFPSTCGPRWEQLWVMNSGLSFCWAVCCQPRSCRCPLWGDWHSRAARASPLPVPGQHGRGWAALPPAVLVISEDTDKRQ